MRLLILFIIPIILLSSHLVYGQDNALVLDEGSVYTIGVAQEQHKRKEYTSAIKTLDTLLNSPLVEEDVKVQFQGYTLLGDIYLTLKDTPSAHEAFERALTMAQKSKNDTLLAISHSNLGKTYSIYPEFEERATALFKKSIDAYTKLNLRDMALQSYIDLSRMHLAQDNIAKAYPALMEAKMMSLRDTQNYKPRAQILTLLGKYYIAKDKSTLAEEALLEAIDISFEQELIAEEEEAQHQIARLYEKDKKFEAAYYHSQRQLLLANQLYKIQTQQEIRQASAQFDYRANKRELEITKKEKSLTDILAASSRKANTVLIVASSLLFLGLFIIFTMYKSRKNYSDRLREKNIELTKAKNEAEQLSKLKTQFFSTISHELRTPLYGVIGIATILLEDKKIKTHRDDLKSLKFSADYLLALINDVLLMSKMEAKDIKLEHAPFKLTTLLHSITRSFEFSLEQNNNKLHLHIDPEVPNELQGDSVRLSQILMNLIGNAIKFNENGNIWVNIHQQARTNDGSHSILFVVKDDGIGIPKSSQATIFEEFTQIENKNYNYQGTGLGLPIVKKLLALYNSEVVLESDEGQGATFSFVIKFEKPKSTALPRQVITSNKLLETESVHTLQDAHILVVDDNRINQKITQKLLESKGLLCSLASDGEEAVEMAKKQEYSLILMDIHMPKKDGIQATKEIRTFDNSTPIVALTAVEIQEIRHKIYKAGMDDILVKPYDVSLFLSVLVRNIKNKHIVTA
ncbi:MAG: response regulator [Dokdonia donghaensis]|jgi:signal transduction histidine kinase/ActR/RegA family two-component response regulator|nr:response regulator [Dokdonia donghaensis]